MKTKLTSNRHTKNRQTMKDNYSTPRLLLNKLTVSDTELILELVNSPEWIKFIGNRNIKTTEEAIPYIQKIIDNPAINYWVVKIQDQQIPIGIVTFIKRDYLDHHDIGFAFLAKYTKQGYAYEATAAVLNDVIKDAAHTHILATTVKENTNSIQLLEKLGFQFNNEINHEDEMLLVYSVTTDKLFINHLTKIFFSIFTNSKQQQPDWNIIHSICLPETIIIKKSDATEIVYSLDTFIEPRKKILSDGTLTEFEEKETNEETKIVGNIAQRWSKYQKTGYLNGNYFKEYGNKLFQFIKTQNGWKINSLIWEDDKN
ncbi:MAG: GNAT family N-acetyltransferase [Sphingobacteriales bacterium]